MTASTVPTSEPARHPPRRHSRRARIARALNVSEAVADKKLYGERSVNRECARIITSDLEAGDSEAAAVFLAAIDAAAGSRTILPLAQAIHEAECADNAEQTAEEAFRHAVQEGVATLEQAYEYLRKSAIARDKAERAEQSVRRWIEEQEAQR